MSSLDLPILFNFDIMFTVIEDGIIASPNMNSTVSADSYSEPINERIERGITSKATTNGAVKLKLILRLADDKSFCNVVECGITMYAMLVAKLATTREIINTT